MSRLAGALAHVEALNLAYSYQGSPGDILARIGSTDRSGSYVFPVRAEPVGRSGSKTSVYWQVSSGFDSMYTLWNPGLTDVDVLVTLRYDNGTGLYEMPVHLVPHASVMIDIGELARQRMPDFQGRLLPLSPIEGSLLVSGPQNGPEDMIDVVLAEGIYNPRKATFGGGCVTCNGWTSPCFDPVTGFLVPPAGNQQGQLCYNYYNGWVYWITSSSNWSSSNTSIATVQTHGQGSPGLTAGVSEGTAWIGAQSTNWIPVNAGQICSSEPITCPTAPVGSGSTVSVQVPTSLSIVSGTDSTTSENTCTTGGLTGCGVTRTLTYQVLDRQGQPIRRSMSFYDTISNSGQDGCNLTSYTTTCSPPEHRPMWRVHGFQWAIPRNTVDLRAGLSLRKRMHYGLHHRRHPGLVCRRQQPNNQEPLLPVR